MNATPQVKCDNADSASPTILQTHPLSSDGEIDVTLLQDSLAKTPWERMQANDDALNFGDALRDAMQHGHAKS